MVGPFLSQLDATATWSESRCSVYILATRKSWRESCALCTSSPVYLSSFQINKEKVVYTTYTRVNNGPDPELKRSYDVSSLFARDKKEAQRLTRNFCCLLSVRHPSISRRVFGNNGTAPLRTPVLSKPRRLYHDVVDGEPIHCRCGAFHLISTGFRPIFALIRVGIFR